MATKTIKPRAASRSRKVLSPDEKKQKAEIAKRIAAAKKLEAKKEKQLKEIAKKRESGDTKDIYFVDLSLNGEVWSASNESLAKAILELRPTKQIKTKAVLSVEFNGKKLERYFLPKNLKRALINDTSAVFLAKNIMFLLN